MHNLAIKEEYYTYRDYITWNDNIFWELINGIPYNMAPPDRKHQEISGDLFRQFSSYLFGKTCRVYSAPFGVRLPVENEEDEYIKDAVLPDIVIVCDKKKLDKAGCRGAPDLIIEILSPSTAKNDMKDKFLLYQRAGVKEYWIVEPNNKIVMVYKIGEDNKYSMPEIYTAEDKIKPGIPGELEIDMESVFRE